MLPDTDVIDLHRGRDAGGSAIRALRIVENQVLGRSGNPGSDLAHFNSIIIIGDGSRFPIGSKSVPAGVVAIGAGAWTT